jgi:N-acetylmuramoyl-L-alanine amidase
MASYHTVEEGECLASIAWKYGFANHRTIFDDPQNANLKEKRPNPNVLYPGDRVFIPDKQQKEEPCGTGQQHHFQVDRQQTFLRLRLIDSLGEVFAKKKYILQVGAKYSDGTREKSYEGTTDELGELKHQIPPDSKHGELKILCKEEEAQEVWCTFQLRIGSLHPLEYVSGAEARLNNLGFFASYQVEKKPKLSDRGQRALQRFWTAMKWAGSNELDEPTERMLNNAHGS